GAALRGRADRPSHAEAVGTVAAVDRALLQPWRARCGPVRRIGFGVCCRARVRAQVCRQRDQPGLRGDCPETDRRRVAAATLSPAVRRCRNTEQAQGILTACVGAQLLTGATDSSIHSRRVLATTSTASPGCNRTALQRLNSLPAAVPWPSVTNNSFRSAPPSMPCRAPASTPHALMASPRCGT